MRVLRGYLAPFRGLPRVVWWLALASFVNRSGHMVVPFLTIYATRERGLSVSQAGALLACLGVGALAGMWLGGVLTDRVGCRRVQITSLFATAGGLALIPFVPGFLGLAAAVGLLGVVTETFRPANTAAVSLCAGDAERARSFALVRLAANVGWTIGPALGGVLARIDHGLLFAVDALTCTLAAFILAGVRDLAKLGGPEPDGGEGSPLEARPRAGTSPWRDPVMRVGLALFFLQGLVFFQVISSFPLFATRHGGLTERGVGFLLASNAAVVVLLEMQIVHRVGHWNPMRLLGLAGLLTGLGFGLLPWLGGGANLVVGVIVFTFGEMLAAPIMATWVSSRSGQARRGAYLAAMGMSFAAAGVVGPWLGTWTLDAHGPYVLFGGCAVVGVVTLVTFEWLQRTAEPRRATGRTSAGDEGVA